MERVRLSCSIAYAGEKRTWGGASSYTEPIRGTSELMTPLAQWESARRMAEGGVSG